MRYILNLFDWKEKRETPSDLSFKEGDVVIVDLGFGKHLGQICQIAEDPCKECNGFESVCTIVRKATSLEKEKVKLSEAKRSELVKKCRQLIKKYALPMKLIGVDVSIDGGGLIFGFSAEERVDFRYLVKDLAGIFQKSVRLQQIGSRDEAKIQGGIGPCGRNLCCLSKKLSTQSISTDMARLQQISHRGNERLSGCCNRLMCCLSFEQPVYEKMKVGLPNIGDKVKIGQEEGIVENLKILSREVGLRLNNSKNKNEITWFPAEQISQKSK